MVAPLSRLSRAAVSPSLCSVNVHTEAYPAGAIRGQLMTVNDMGDDMGGMEPSMEPSMAPEMAPTPTMAPTGGAGRIGFSMAALAAALAAMLL